MTSDSTIDDQAFILMDNWPGIPVSMTRPYDDFLTTSAGQDVTSPDQYPIGTKIQVHCPGTAGAPGPSIFIYLGLAATEANPTPAAKQIVVPVSASNCFHVTNDPDAAILVDGSPLAAMMLSAMTAWVTTIIRYGWFWCGGVCPVDYISDLGGNHKTNGDVVKGPIAVGDSQDTDVIAIGNRATTEGMIGTALADD